jgi:type III pantothenate kinase
MRKGLRMNLVVDIGNTNIVCGVYSSDRLVWHARLRTDRSRTADEYYSLLKSLKDNTWDMADIQKSVLASVVPDLTRMWQHLLLKYFGQSPLVINGNLQLGLTYVVDDPSFIGADLIVNALAAWKKYQCNCLIIDFGTATTLQFVTSKGLFMGAVIAPGMRTAAQNLFEKAALLSEVELTGPSAILGTNTKDAMLSGIVRGHALMIVQFIDLLKKEYNDYKPLKVICTGGISELLAPLISSIDLIDKTLTLDGLNLAAKILETED